MLPVVLQGHCCVEMTAEEGRENHSNTYKIVKKPSHSVAHFVTWKLNCPVVEFG